jgi:hypothetical protein
MVGITTHQSKALAIGAVQYMYELRLVFQEAQDHEGKDAGKHNTVMRQALKALMDGNVVFAIFVFHDVQILL